MWHKFIDGELYVDLNSKEEVDDFLNQCAIRGLRWASGDKANEGVMKKHCQHGMLVTYRIYDFANKKRGLLAALSEPTDKKRIIKWSDFMNNVFRKEDLKTGDVIQQRNGDVRIVIRELNILIGKESELSLDNYNEDMAAKDKHFDIMAVRRPNHNVACNFRAFDFDYGILIYERKEPEEMTLAEVCKLLGKEIKIVK